MKQAFSGLVLRTLLVVSIAFLPAAVLAQMGPHMVTGVWQVRSGGEQFHSGTVHMSQTGYTIVGNSRMARGMMNFTGKLNNDTLSGTWRGPTGETGWLTLHFAPSFRSFNGEYGYHGRKPSGTMVGKLVRHTTM